VRSRALFFVLLLAGATLTYFRDPNLYRLPIAAYEDGRDMFGYFYNHPEPSSVWRFYNGYVSLVPNAAGYLAARMPTPRIPLALALFPLAVAAVGFASLARPEFRRLVESDRLRWVACLALALAPLGNHLFVSSTTYSVWNLLFLLVLLTLLEPPTGRWEALLRWAVMAALIWSNPVSVALLPVFLLQGWLHRSRGRRSRLYYGGLAAAAVLYQLVGVEHSSEAMAFTPLAIARVTGVLVLERVFFNTVASDQLSRTLRRSGADAWIYVVALLVVALLVVAVIALRRRLDGGRLLNISILSYLIVALTALYVIGRSATLDILTGNPGYRYFWVQRLCLIVLIFLLVEPLLSVFEGRRRMIAAAILLLLLGGNLFWLNRMDNSKYRGKPGQGRKLAAFTEEVALQERTGDGAVSARHERGRWSIVLERPGSGGGR
jgi:hypothetical protein